MKAFLDKILDIINIISEKLDYLSEKIFEQTKTKVDLKIILGGALGLIVIIIFVKAILGYVFSQL